MTTSLSKASQHELWYKVFLLESEHGRCRSVKEQVRSLSQCASGDGTQRMVVEKLSYAIDPPKCFVQPRLGYLSYNQCGCSPHTETIQIKESSRICKHKLVEMFRTYVKPECAFAGRRMRKKHISGPSEI